MRIILALVGIGLLLWALFSIFDLPEQAPGAVPTRSHPAAEPAEPAGWQAQAPLSYVGTQRCMECHEEEHAEWMGSHHQLAMLPATEESVLGDFSGSTFTSKDGTTSTFYKDGDAFMVRTDGPDGELQDFHITHTFGVTPLQMYLIPFPDGRVQCLNVSWDSRPAEAGGQRWFHLYPDEVVDHEHVFHWTRRYQNWNYMCAECHSTRLEKRYDVQSDTYDTRWFEINVACEACHGPGSQHAEWADAGEPPEVPDTGLVHRMGGARLGDWHVDPVTGKPRTTQLPRNMSRSTSAPAAIPAAAS
ncbi:MAG: multiheme c-type cytochrome [Planctomycetota bacterium]